MDRALSGGDLDLKEYVVGLEVFDKPEDFDPKVDSTVRTTALRVRQSLKLYYEGDVRNDRVVIEYLPGSYVPLFKIRASGTSHLLRLLAVAGLLAVAIVANSVSIHFSSGSNTDLDRRRSPTQFSYPDREVSPSFSPDGSQIAFHSTKGVSAKNAIYRKAVGGGLTVQLTSGDDDDRDPAWSPDGTVIAFIRNYGPGGSVHLVDPDGRDSGKLVDTTAASIAWHPSGKRLAVMERASPEAPFRIDIVDFPTGRRSTVLPPSLRPGCGDFLTFSPNGTSLAFVDGLTCSLYVAPIDLQTMRLGEAKRLADSIELYGFDWMDDGEILVSADLGSGPALSLVSASAAHETRTLQLERLPAQRPAIWRGPDGKSSRLAYEAYYPRINLWRIELSAGRQPIGSPLPIASSNREEGGAQFSPDASMIAFVSSRDRGYGIFVCNSDGSRTQRLYSEPGKFRGSPRWSPDIRRIAFDALEGTNRDVWVIELATGRLTRITATSSQESRPNWSADGNWIYFNSDRLSPGTFDLWKARSDGSGDAIKVTEGGGFEGMESPDGLYLYYVKSGERPGLWRMRATGGASELISEEVYDGHWTIVREGVYFVNFTGRHAGKSREVDFISFPTLKKSTLFQTDADFTRVWPGLTVSPDGRFMVVPLQDNHGSEITVINDLSGMVRGTAR